MENISVNTCFSIGDIDLVNKRVEMKLHIIRAILKVLDTEGISARIDLIADTTEGMEDVDLKIICNDDNFTELAKDCIYQCSSYFRSARVA